MKKAMSGGLVDFKENLIFEEWKDQPLHSSVWFRDKMKEKYGITKTTDLYAKIVNYQIKKYGTNLLHGKNIEFINNIKSTSHKCRKHNSERTKTQYELKKFIERNEG